VNYTRVNFDAQFNIKINTFQLALRQTKYHTILNHR